MQRRRLVAGAIAAALALGSATAGALTGAGAEETLPASDAAEPAAKAGAGGPPSLPRGGRSIFPQQRVVAYYGAPQDEELGALGIGTPASAARRLERQAKAYGRPDRPVLPALELIAVIGRYVRAARRAKALLLLDIQPGASDFFTEATRLERWLREPDVALALDPEWRVGPGQIPGKVIGSVRADEVNRVTRYVRGIVRKGRLPQKLLLIHQFTPDMIPDKQELVRPRELAMTINVDGFGNRPEKEGKYTELAPDARGFHHGFKLFYEEDTGLMTPSQVLGLRPRPEIVVYE